MCAAGASPAAFAERVDISLWLHILQVCGFSQREPFQSVPFDPAKHKRGEPCVCALFVLSARVDVMAQGAPRRCEKPQRLGLCG